MYTSGLFDSATSLCCFVHKVSHKVMDLCMQDYLFVIKLEFVFECVRCQCIGCDVAEGILKSVDPNLGFSMHCNALAFIHGVTKFTS